MYVVGTSNSFVYVKHPSIKVLNPWDVDRQTCSAECLVTLDSVLHRGSLIFDISARRFFAVWDVGALLYLPTRGKTRPPSVGFCGRLSERPAGAAATPWQLQPEPLILVYPIFFKSFAWESSQDVCTSGGLLTSYLSLGLDKDRTPIACDELRPSYDLLGLAHWVAAGYTCQKVRNRFRPHRSWKRLGVTKSVLETWYYDVV